jgi:hypothetical protein
VYVVLRRWPLLVLPRLCRRATPLLPRSKAAVLHASSTSVRGHWHLGSVRQSLSAIHEIIFFFSHNKSALELEKKYSFSDDEMHGPGGHGQHRQQVTFASATWRPSQSLRTCARACSEGRIQGEELRRRLTGPPVDLLLSMHTERPLEYRVGEFCTGRRQRDAAADTAAQWKN